MLLVDRNNSITETYGKQKISRFQVLFLKVKPIHFEAFSSCDASIFPNFPKTYVVVIVNTVNLSIDPKAQRENILKRVKSNLRNFTGPKLLRSNKKLILVLMCFVIILSIDFRNT